jgi:ribosomal protein L32
MTAPNRMPRYDVRNDGAGPYAIFYCDECGREFRSLPDVGTTIAKDISRQTMGGLLRNIPLVGGALANNVAGEDPRYTYQLSAPQLENAWNQVKEHFRECPTCNRVVCLSDFDERSGFCNQDSPRSDEIAQSQGQQVGAALKGFASAFGLGEAIEKASQAAKKAPTQMARCPNDGTFAPAGTKFCPECGAQMVQPQVETCPNCGAQTFGAKFCPECGTKLEAEKPRPTHCPNCGAETGGAKFCPECGTKLM